MTLTASELALQHKTTTPPITTIIQDTLETCLHLRSKKDYKPLIEDGSSGAVKKESKLPFNATAIDLCDAEVRVLGYWADQLDIPIYSRCWRLNGFIWGTRGDDLSVVKELQFKLLVAVRSRVPAGMVSGRWGVWSQRRRTFDAFPDVASRMMTQIVEQEIEQEGLFNA